MNIQKDNIKFGTSIKVVEDLDITIWNEDGDEPRQTILTISKGASGIVIGTQNEELCIIEFTIAKFFKISVSCNEENQNSFKIIK